MALTQAEKYLIQGLKLFGMTETETIGVMLALKTPEQQDRMLEWLTENPQATPSDIIGKTMDIVADRN